MFLPRHRELADAGSTGTHLPFRSGKVLLYLRAHVLLDVLIWSGATGDPAAQNGNGRRSTEAFGGHSHYSLLSCKAGFCRHLIISDGFWKSNKKTTQYLEDWEQRPLHLSLVTVFHFLSKGVWLRWAKKCGFHLSDIQITFHSYESIIGPILCIKDVHSGWWTNKFLF